MPRGAWHEFSAEELLLGGARFTDADRVPHDAQTRAFLIAAVPTQRSGISIADDWNNIGQRQTDSSTVTFEKVRVEDHELLTDPRRCRRRSRACACSSRSWC